MTVIEIGQYFAIAMNGLIFLFASIVLAGGVLAYLTMGQEKANGLRAAR